MTIRDELVTLQQRDGVLKPEVAVEWARSHPTSALHSALDWNDTTAAQQYRIWQIRQLIAVHVVNEKGVRQIVSLSIDRVNDGGGYRDLDTVMSSPPLREVLLSDALTDLERARLKYEGLTELARVWSEVRRVKTKQAKRSGARKQLSRPQQRRVKQAERSAAKPSKAARYIEKRSQAMQA